jgi:hypothetical protein
VDLQGYSDERELLNEHVLLQCECEIVLRLIFQKCLGLDAGQALFQNQCSKGPDFQGQKNACHSSTQKEE